jgi:prepilin-type processing-associated H-X9-DG protein
VDPSWPGQNNYYGNLGGQFLCDLSEALPSTLVPQAKADGVFYYLSHVKLIDISDGTSETAMFSEKLRGIGAAYYPKLDMFSIPNPIAPASPPAAGLAALKAACDGVNTLTNPTLTSRQGYSWVMGEMCCTTYNHVGLPNTNTCSVQPGTFGPSMSDMGMQVPPTSHHTGGVNVLMCDGDVRFIVDSISFPTWHALGTRNGLEILGPDW